MQRVHPVGLSIDISIKGLISQKSLKLFAPRMILGDSVKVDSHDIQYIYVCRLQIIM